jgi:hypothetical protein
MARIALSDGREIRTFEPPPHGFDPFTASPAELARHGFPPLPTDPHHLARYRRLMNELKGRFRYVPPTFRELEIKADVQTSNTWSGGVVYAPTGTSFQWIQGDWAVPGVAAEDQNEWEYMSSWIGIDDANPCQVGVTCEIYQSGSNITTNPPFAWYEWVPAKGQAITSLSVSPGDMVTAVLCTQQGAGSTSATVFFINRTTGAATSFVLYAPNNVALVGNSAEWIVERPTLNAQDGTIAKLPFYGGLLFSNCEAVLTDGTTVNGGSGNSIIMTDMVTGEVLSVGNLFPPTDILCLHIAGTS